MTDDPGASHWVRWHADYADPDSLLSRRLAAVTRRVRDAVDGAAPGPVRLVSACAGQGRDVVGALTGHPRADDVRARLVEADAHNVAVARGLVADAGLTGVEVVHGDASTTDAYEGAVPADVVLLCGIFGNVADEDVRTTVAHTSRLCSPGAVVVWTRHRGAPDLTTSIRAWFAGSGFDEVAFDSPGPESWAVRTHQLAGPALPFRRGLHLFTFR